VDHAGVAMGEPFADGILHAMLRCQMRIQSIGCRPPVCGTLAPMKQVRMPSGDLVPALGQGTWGMGEQRSARAQEIATLRAGIERGLVLIDTAEMYGEGRTETLVGEAIAGLRDEVFLVSKVYPHHASRKAMRSACVASLRRLGTDRLDLYLLHWAGGVPIAETVAAFEALQRDGLIRGWGVSNLDTDAMEELWAVSGGRAVQANQVLYNLTRRGIEWDLLPWQRKRGIPTMAYCPIEQGRLLCDRKLADFARRHVMTPAQAALAWLLARDDVIAIPKTSRLERLEENLAATGHPLGVALLAELDGLFPPPSGPVPLEMI
jgi:diketogulonate reductase-like aldo/keto reductase